MRSLAQVDLILWVSVLISVILIAYLCSSFFVLNGIAQSIKDLIGPLLWPLVYATILYVRGD